MRRLKLLKNSTHCQLDGCGLEKLGAKAMSCTFYPLITTPSSFDKTVASPNTIDVSPMSFARNLGGTNDDKEYETFENSKFSSDRGEQTMKLEAAREAAANKSNEWRQPSNDHEIRTMARRRLAGILRTGQGANRDESREQRVLQALENLCYKSAGSREEFTNSTSFEILLHRIASEKAKRRRLLSSKSSVGSTVSKASNSKRDATAKAQASSSESSKSRTPEPFSELLYSFCGMDPNHAQGQERRRHDYERKAGKLECVDEQASVTSKRKMHQNESWHEVLKPHPDVGISNTIDITKEMCTYTNEVTHQHIQQRQLGARGAAEIWQQYQQDQLMRQYRINQHILQQEQEQEQQQHGQLYHHHDYQTQHVHHPQPMHKQQYHMHQHHQPIQHESSSHDYFTAFGPAETLQNEVMYEHDGYERTRPVVGLKRKAQSDDTFDRNEPACFNPRYQSSG